MANEDKQNQPKENELPAENEQQPDGLSAEQAAEPVYDEKEGLG